MRAQQMKRATSGVFDRLWHHIVHGPVYGSIPFPVASELLAACCWCPFYFADFRQPSHGTVICSVASMSGAGTCFLSGLSRSGSRAVEKEPVDSGQLTEESLRLLALFDGIGGGRRAMQLLGVTPGAFYSCLAPSAAPRRH